MHEIEKKIIDSGAIDTEIENIHIDDWFENAVITFKGSGNSGRVVCEFEQCFEITMKHDRAYTKGKNPNDSLDYKYFIQDIEIVEEEEFYIAKISAWPLNGKIVCKEILINANR